MRYIRDERLGTAAMIAAQGPGQGNGSEIRDRGGLPFAVGHDLDPRIAVGAP